MTKKKILLVECFAHFQNAKETYNFFSQKYNIKVFTLNKFSKRFGLPNNSIICSKYYLTFYLKLYFISYLYDYIYISTPPEYPDKVRNPKDLIIFIFHYIFFLIHILLYKNKSILQIRSIHRYIPSCKVLNIDKSFLPHFRYYLIFLVNRIVLESKFLKEILKKKFQLKYKNKLISYFYIAHQNSKKIEKFSNKKIQKNSIKKIRIGVLGQIDPLRKNYKLLLEIFKRSSFKSKFQLIFLGRAINSKSIKIINEFKRNKIDFIYFNKYISDKRFKLYGKSCDFLMSLNTKINYYGRYRLSGSFGDAIILKKKLIAPYFEDPYREFKDFTSYFKKKEDLIKLLDCKKFMKINFNKFKSTDNLKRLKKELKI
ncbi:hypothetical protein N9317_06065 [Pelagibacteraceae bacterium]|nr:hypothetical protein [Pelagibacteraceae bacterium]